MRTMQAGDDDDRIVQGRLVAERWSRLALAVEQLAGARSLDAVIEILRSSARRIVSADGITIVLKDGHLCHYVAEDAMEPLWAGQKFPAKTCVSGWAMMHAETVLIPDIHLDQRVPQDAYRATFVRSMAMVPIGVPHPIGAVGAYWSEAGQPSGDEIALLESLTRAAATSLENGRLLGALEQLNGALEAKVVERTAELEAAQEALRHAQKLEAIGQLTGNVAHDFNNLLAPIMGSIDLIMYRTEDGSPVHRSAGIAMEAAERAKMLVQRLLAFARRQPLAPTTIDPRDLIEGMRPLLSSTLGSRVELTIETDADLPGIKADRHQLEMAIINLAVNSRDAISGNGRLSISARIGGALRPAGLPAGEFVCLTVSDNGAGMDAATLDKAIEPFFSTKSAGHGTGLGLSMVHGLANQLGGALDIASAPGEGTHVTLWLPVADNKAETAKAAAQEDVPTGKGETVLVVDDEPLVRQGTAAMVAALGYDVVEAENGREGMNLIERGLRPAVVVTDHIMPGMTGAELALRLRSESPQIAVMIVSGYQGIDLIAPDVVRLSKPFRQTHLAASIAAARDQVAAAA